MSRPGFVRHILMVFEARRAWAVHGTPLPAEVHSGDLVTRSSAVLHSVWGRITALLAQQAFTPRVPRVEWVEDYARMEISIEYTTGYGSREQHGQVQPALHKLVSAQFEEEPFLCMVWVTQNNRS